MVSSAQARVYEFVGAHFPGILEPSVDGSVKGLGADITYKIAKALHIEVKITLYPLKRALLMMKRGEADVIIGPYKAADRMSYLDYTSFSFYEDPIVLYTRKDTKLNWAGNLEVLKGLKIGVIRGWSLGRDFNEMSTRGELDVINLSAIDQLFPMLKRKRIDIAIAHPRESRAILSREEFNKEIISLKPALTTNEGYFGFSKSRDLEEFKKQFEAEYEKIYNK